MSLSESLTSISYLSRDLSSVVLPARQYLNYPTCRWQTACTATGTTATEVGGMSFDRNVIWFCHVADLSWLVLLLSQWTCHFAVSMNLSLCCLDELIVFMLSWWTYCLYAVLMNLLSLCCLDELVLLPSRWTCLYAVLMNLSCCRLDELVLLPSLGCLDLIVLPSWSWSRLVLKLVLFRHSAVSELA